MSHGFEAFEEAVVGFGGVWTVRGSGPDSFHVVQARNAFVVHDPLGSPMRVFRYAPAGWMGDVDRAALDRAGRDADRWAQALNEGGNRRERALREGGL